MAYSSLSGQRRFDRAFRYLDRAHACRWWQFRAWMVWRVRARLAAHDDAPLAYLREVRDWPMARLRFTCNVGMIDW